MIEITDVYKSYKSFQGNIDALKGVNLKVEKGQIYGVIGFSGAGKSSLLRCINMLEKPSSGKIIVNNQDMTILKGAYLRQARKKIGMIFQHFNLLETCTVFQNIAIALELSNVPQEIIKTKVNSLLQVVGLEEKANSYPSQLSGGQKQRVAIARALANDIDILLCDEATSALDPQTTESILDLILDINKQFNLTILLITHEMAVIKKVCDRVGVIEDGKIIEEDTLINIFTRPQLKTTKNFIASIMEEKLAPGIIEKLLDKARNLKLLRLTFVGCGAAEPLLAKIAKELPIWPNILGGNIIQIKGQTLGRLIVALEGETPYIDQALAILDNHGVLAEVLDYGLI